MTTKKRIDLIRLAEKLEKAEEYAEEIGVKIVLKKTCIQPESSTDIIFQQNIFPDHDCT